MTFPEGNYQLTPRVTLQGASRTGEAVEVVVDRTGPFMTTTAPAPTVEVDVDTVFTINFNEVVTAAPLAVSDVVRLSVTPIGQSTVAIAFTAELDSAGRQLTVRPAAGLPLGIASVSWESLHDAAGNTVTGTIAANWNVARSARLGADLELQTSSALGMVTDATGVVHVVRHLRPDNNLQALQFDGTDFVPIGPTINDRPIPPDPAATGAHA